MKIRNATFYDTRELRRLFVAVFRAQTKTFQARVPQWKQLRIVVCHSRCARTDQHGWKIEHYEKLGMHDAAETWRRYIEQKKASRSLHVTGCAVVNGSRATLRVPSGEVATDHLAAVLVHELWHIAGSRHKDMPPGAIRCDVHPFAWVIEKFGRKLSEQKPSPTPKARIDRRARVEARLRVWERKLRRAERAVRKLKKQLRYYERKTGTGSA